MHSFTSRFSLFRCFPSFVLASPRFAEFAIFSHTQGNVWNRTRAKREKRGETKRNEGKPGETKKGGPPLRRLPPFLTDFHLNIIQCISCIFVGWPRWIRVGQPVRAGEGGLSQVRGSASQDGRRRPWRATNSTMIFCWALITILNDTQTNELSVMNNNLISKSWLTTLIRKRIFIFEFDRVFIFSTALDPRISWIKD